MDGDGDGQVSSGDVETVLRAITAGEVSLSELEVRALCVQLARELSSASVSGSALMSASPPTIGRDQVVGRHMVDVLLVEKHDGRHGFPSSVASSSS